VAADQVKAAKPKAKKAGKRKAAADDGVRRCRVCGCTDDDCTQCVEANGEPCHWVEADLCSRCAEEAAARPSPAPEPKTRRGRKQQVDAGNQASEILLSGETIIKYGGDPDLSTDADETAEDPF
jgi:hypothetical protein